ncbi:hypothetical protein A9Z06_07200 [Rhizobium sp. YK2]|nr:hypothetical protein A9Z06_07200 [Rhizobium sp. YK2]
MPRARFMPAAKIHHRMQVSSDLILIAPGVAGMLETGQSASRFGRYPRLRRRRNFAILGVRVPSRCLAFDLL